MILIADSGSTKTDWCLLHEGKLMKQVMTKGINPFYQTETEILQALAAELIPELETAKVSSIYFYGAGCSFPERKLQVSNALLAHFEQSSIEVESDLLGAARAMFGREKGVAGILGTGSNSCLYNGESIVENVSPLGFILGDEGSGAVLGKRFVSDCLKNQLPDDLRNKFLATFELTPATILDRVYKQVFPNRFLAGFTPFLSANIQHPAIYQIIYESFVDYFQRNIMQYDYLTNKVRLTGSVAYYFSHTLIKAAADCGVEIDSIDKNPMQGLIDFYK